MHIIEHVCLPDESELKKLIRILVPRHTEYMVYLHQATGFIIVNVNYRGFQKVWELCKSNLTLRRFLKWADVLEECLHEYTMTVVNPAEIPGLNLIEMCLRDISEGVVIFRRRAHT